MRQRYNDLTHELCVQAVALSLDHKWRRNDTLCAVEKYAGIPRAELLTAAKENNVWPQIEAAEAIAAEMENRIEELLDGTAPDLDLDPVILKPRRDGMTGKIREIAQCSVLHQAFGHLAYLGLEPLFKARLLPCQFASIPGKGQVAMKRHIERCFRQERRNIRYAQKTDVHHAYGTLQYSTVIQLIRQDIPDATWIIAVLEAISKAAPGGHLIIGGYIDAWLFNYAMSYALRYIDGAGSTRRGKRRPAATAHPAYMDDFGLCGPRLASLKSIKRKLGKWAQAALGLELKPAGKVTAILPAEAEKALRHPPGLDMGGYVVHRTFTTIRRAIFIRARRQFLRAWAELKRTGTMYLFRARKIASYNGYFKHSNSRKVFARLHGPELMKLARRIIRAKERRKAKCYLPT